MPSELELEIQQHIQKYLAGQESLADFENWFAPVLWDIDDQPQEARELAGLVHVLLGELSTGDLSSAAFKSKLAQSIKTYAL